MKNFRVIIRRILLLALLLPVFAWAQNLEVISLRHRSAEQLVPQLRPFLDAGAALTGSGEKLFVRTSPGNLAQLKELVAGMDTPVRRLMISVRSDSGADDAGNHGGSGGGSGGGSRGDVRISDRKVSPGGTASVYSSDRHRSSDVYQQVQTIDGGQARLYVGQSFVLPMRQVIFGAGGTIVSDTLVQREVGSGFVAVPRLSGDTVSLEISPQVESLSSPVGVLDSQRLSTTVSGRLGEWIMLGGNETRAMESESGSAHYSTRRAGKQGRFLLKVDVLP